MRLLVLLVVSGVGWAQSPKLELAIAPVAVQLNGKYTQHVGTFGSVTLQLREGIGLQVLGGGNWINGESAFNGELAEKFRVEAQAASALLWTWGVFGGVELEPFVGELAVLEGPRVRLGLVVSVGAGAGGTRHQLKPAGATPATFADTGVRFMGTFAVGALLRLGDQLTLRLGVRDVLYSAQVKTVNGCSDVGNPFQLKLDGGGAACPGIAPDDIARASSLLQFSNSDVLHNLGLSLALGFVF